MIRAEVVWETLMPATEFQTTTAFYGAGVSGWGIHKQGGGHGAAARGWRPAADEAAS